ncbi:MAG: ATP-binding protein, partial [Minisyncoccia bacterium]
VNLVGNALKFTQKGGVKIKTEITGIKPKMVLIKVIDTGLGITKKDQKLLFRKFQQLGKILNRQPGGTGLGLYISKQLVEKMGGKIWLEKSVVGKGSVFAFTIPLFKYGKKR